MKSKQWQVEQGDCLEVMQRMPSASVDAMVADPPSGAGLFDLEWDSKGGRDAWIEWLRRVMVEARRVLKPGAHALVWSYPRTSHWTGVGARERRVSVRFSAARRKIATTLMRARQWAVQLRRRSQRGTSLRVSGHPSDPGTAEPPHATRFSFRNSAASKFVNIRRPRCVR
jgi:hypothetical protein